MRLFSDNLSAGFPSAAEGYEDEPLNLHDWIVRNPAATFLYRVRGRDLEHEHVCDGSVLVVDRSVRPTDKRLIVAEVDGVFVVCRYRPGVPATIVGVVVGDEEAADRSLD
jgi:DNA polymerase V